MAPRHVDIFENLRASVLVALVDSSSALDEAWAALPEAIRQRHFKTILRQMHAYLMHPESEGLKLTVSQWVAMLLAEGLTPPSVLRTVVAVGDRVAETAGLELEPGPETNLFIRDVLRCQFHATHEIVRIFHAEYKELAL